MKAVLDALSFEAGNLCNSNSEVHVQFEYEKLKERKSEILFTCVCRC